MLLPLGGDGSSPRTATAAPSGNGLSHRNVRVCAAPTLRCRRLRRRSCTRRCASRPASPGPGGLVAQLASARRICSPPTNSPARTEAADGRDRRCPRRPERGVGPGGLPQPYGLPACTTANGCFKKVNQSGQHHQATPGTTATGPRRSPSTSTWSPRSAPTATSCWSRRRPPTPGQPRRGGQRSGGLVGATEISNSYGGAESAATQATTRTTITQASPSPPAPATAATGRSIPRVLAYVTAVGGTSLRHASNARGWTETVWSGSGPRVLRLRRPAVVADGGHSDTRAAPTGHRRRVGRGRPQHRVRRLRLLPYQGSQRLARLRRHQRVVADHRRGLRPGGQRRDGGATASYPYSHTAALYDVISGSNG